MSEVMEPKPYTEPGSLDLAANLPSHPYFREEAQRDRAGCDPLGHPPGCYNPLSDTTYCRCGMVQYPGDCAPLPEPRARPAVVSKPMTDPAWSARRAS